MDNLKKQTTNKKQNVSEMTVNIDTPKPVKRCYVAEGGVTGVDSIDCLNLDELVLMRHYSCNVKLRKSYYQRLAFLTAEKDKKRTEEILAKRKRLTKMRYENRQKLLGAKAGTGGNIFSESAEVGDMDMSSASISTTHENLVDRTGEIESNVSAGQSLHDAQDGGVTTHNLDEFFSRPVSLYDGTIATETEANIVLRLWDIWSLNPAVRAKLSNYAFFKGNLHIKIAVSGTPYHYGRLMASYQPYAKHNDILNKYDDLLGATAPAAIAVYPPYKCYLSQAPGVGYIDVKENEPLIMKIPFISYKERFRLYNSTSTVITNNTSLYDFEEAGELRLVTLNPLLIANSDYDTHASINIFGWMTDVELGCISGTNIDITSESADVTDEYTGKGPVSSVASSIMKVGDTLASVPIIGEFAKATSTMAKGVKIVAEFFGWSKPVVLTNTTFVKNSPYHNGATLAGHETTLKLTLDPKQELSVDQSLGGSSNDEMAIASIASRESFLTTFNWFDSDTAMDTVLWRSFITPSYMAGLGTLPSSNNTLNQPTALAYAAAPFAYWRGSIKFRLEFVCSKFHRGKVLIRYEPNTPMSTLIASGVAQLNQQNSIILDLQQSQELTFHIGWAQCRSWASVPSNLLQGIDNTPADLPDQNKIATIVGFLNNELNGYVEVRPINELIQPTPTSKVLVNVYVSSDDMEFMVPTDRALPVSREVIYTESKSVNDVGFLNPKDGHTDKIHLDHFGEKVVSFRALMKRYTTMEAVNGDVAAQGPGVWTIYSRLYPKPAAPIGRPPAGDGDPEMLRTLFDYLRFSYLGMRGGMRKRVVIAYCRDEISQSDFCRTRLLPPTDQHVHNTAMFRTTMNSVTNIKAEQYSSLNGAVQHHINTNGGIEIEVPYYHSDLFQMAFSNTEGWASSPDEDLGINPIYSCAWATSISTIAPTGDNSLMGVTIEGASAEDFTFLRFQGAAFYVTASPG